MNKKRQHHENTKDGFILGFIMIPKKFIPKAPEQIMAKCKWLSGSTFSNKKTGKSVLTMQEDQDLREYFAQYNLNPYTGEYLLPLETKNRTI